METKQQRLKDIYLVVNNDDTCDLEIRTMDANALQFTVEDVRVSMIADSINASRDDVSLLEAKMEEKIKITMRVIRWKKL